MNKKANHSSIAELDGFIKFLLAIVIATLPFYLEKQVSYQLFVLYLLIVTLASGIRYRTLLLSAASYCIIVVIPYLFGILMNISLYYLTRNDAFIISQGAQEVFLRLFRLFIIWYTSILYFHTTPIKTILGLLDRLLYPLKLVKVPVEDYLKVVMCIVTELKGMGEEIKADFLAQGRSVIGGSGHRLKSKFNGIAHIIVATLVNSFQKLDELEGMVEKLNHEELFNYQPRMTQNEGLAALSMSLLILMLYVFEKGNGFII